MNSDVPPDASSKYELKHNSSGFACAQKELIAEIVGLA